jgi:hypothetical protein
MFIIALCKQNLRARQQKNDFLEFYILPQDFCFGIDWPFLLPQ